MYLFTDMVVILNSVVLEIILWDVQETKCTGVVGLFCLVSVPQCLFQNYRFHDGHQIGKKVYHLSIFLFLKGIK